MSTTAFRGSATPGRCEHEAWNRILDQLSGGLESGGDPGQRLARFPFGAAETVGGLQALAYVRDAMRREACWRGAERAVDRGGSGGNGRQGECLGEEFRQTADFLVDLHALGHVGG